MGNHKDLCKVMEMYWENFGICMGKEWGYHGDIIGIHCMY